MEISNFSTIFPRLKATSETERNLLVSKWNKEVRFPVCAEEKEAFEGWPTPLRQTREQQSESGSNSSSAQLLIQLLSRRRVTRIRQLSNQQEATGFIGGRGEEGWGEVEGVGGGRDGSALKWLHEFHQQQQQLFTLISSKKRAVSPSIMGCRRGPLRLLEGEPCGWGGGGTRFRAGPRQGPCCLIRRFCA